MTKHTESGPRTLCLRGCGRLTAGSRVCTKCKGQKLVDSRRYYQERVQRGQCPCCLRSAEVGIFCMTHWFKNVGVSHGLGNKKGIELLRSLWLEQGGRCAVTGERLIPGSTASLDHNIPKSKGGTSDRSNLRWVLLNINRVKWDMTHDEFIAVCRQVVCEQDKREAVKATETISTRSN